MLWLEHQKSLGRALIKVGKYNRLDKKVQTTGSNCVSDEHRDVDRGQGSGRAVTTSFVARSTASPVLRIVQCGRLGRFRSGPTGE